jgi:8-oxo-dGTP diphosphatase
VPLPYKIAVLCYLFDAQGRVLLLHRRKEPNQDLYSPIGGKLETHLGESPAACALREVHEEADLKLRPTDLHLTGLVSETGYLGQAHWLMFLYEVTGPVIVTRQTFAEGRLEWHAPEAIAALPIPDTDRSVIWPLFWRYRGRFFSAHIDCRGEGLRWRLEQPTTDAEESFSCGG